MKHFTYFLALTIFGAFLSIDSHAQCLDFAKTKGFAKLDTSIYIPDGRLNSLPLSEGDDLDVYKPFFRGRKYKVVVVSQDNLPNINFKVVNFQRQVIFDSKVKGNSNGWEFVSDKNQNLIINVEIPKPTTGNPKTGCIAVVVGFQQN